jgi:hypothetical protein
MAAGTTTLPAAWSPGAVEGGGAILAVGTAGFLGGGPPRALERAGVTVVAATAGLLAAGRPDATEGAGVTLVTTTELLGAGAVEDGSATLAPGTTGLGCAGSGGGIDGIGTFRRRAGSRQARSCQRSQHSARLVLPKKIEGWSLTSLQQRLVKTGGRLVKHARYYWLMLAESHLTRRLFGSRVRRIGALTVASG